MNNRASSPRSSSTVPILVGLAAAALAATGVQHVLLTGEYLREAPYIGVSFAIGGAICVALAVILARHALSGRRSALVDLAWRGGVVVAAGFAVGYVLSRTTGLPGFMHEIGEWEPDGALSLWFEGAFLALAALRSRMTRRITAAS